MNDQLLMENYLLILKSTVEVFVHGTLESSNVDVREVLKENLNSTLFHQAQTYDLMTRYGWYNVSNVDVNNIQQTLTNLENKN